MQRNDWLHYPLLYKQYPQIGAKICTDICLRTMSVPRCERFSSIFSRKNIDYGVYHPSNIFQRAWKNFYDWAHCSLRGKFSYECSLVRLYEQKIFPFFCNNHKTLSHLELNFELRPTVVDVRFENCGISLGWYSRITPSFRWGIFGRVTRLDQWWASKNIWLIIIRDICLDKWVT